MVPPRDVANEFVRQYYMILNKCPENAHMFYNESSLLGWQENDGVITPVTTLSAINNKILSSDYKNCFAEVNSVDAQASQDGGVFVAVSGSFIEKDQVTCIFFQTFFLARQERGFFVLNDILRVFNANGLVPFGADDASTVQSDGNISDSSTSSLTDEIGELDESSYVLVPKDTVTKGSSSASPVASPGKMSPAVEQASNANVVAPVKTYLQLLQVKGREFDPRRHCKVFQLSFNTCI
ncbi:putative g3bp-like protein [Phtheirospermum japonicum]|uniref:Putative g3bp-like protein n=1 Tax=Phtheirospermum japonicum TaxID=374723 RepID=A0A830D0W8_9LAMI|nr:putative g3bp-like protein [Phtheirospermum japonicum]